MSETIQSNNEQLEEQSIWGEDYLKDVPEFAGERKFVKLEEIANLYSFENSMISGHGTASAGNGHEIVESIFKEGVRGYESLGSMVGEDRDSRVVGSTDLTNNTVGLWSSLEGDIDFSKMKEKLDNWPHRNAENVILMRFPLDYYHMYTDLPTERTQAYFVEHEDAQGRPTNYIDRRFILGNYNAKTGVVELNPHFEPEISGEFKEELDARLEKVKKQTEERQRKSENDPFVLPSAERDVSDSDEDDEFDLGDFDSDDFDWQ